MSLSGQHPTRAWERGTTAITSRSQPSSRACLIKASALLWDIFCSHVRAMFRAALVVSSPSGLSTIASSYREEGGGE